MVEQKPCITCHEFLLAVPTFHTLKIYLVSHMSLAFIVVIMVVNHWLWEIFVASALRPHIYIYIYRC